MHPHAEFGNMHCMNAVLSDLLRLLQNLIRLGTIAEVKGAKARVRLGPTLTTEWLKWATRCAGSTRTWSAPTVGEQVIVFSPGGDLTRGIILPALYSQAFDAPEFSDSIHTTHYPDGAVVQYDHASHALTATLRGGTANPIDQLDMSSYKTGRREVLATHAQVQAIREAGMMSKERKGTGLSIPTASGPMFACIIDMSYLLWARGIDIRMLKESQIKDGLIRIKPSKTQKTSGKAVDIVVTPAIAEVIARARGLKTKYGRISQFVLPTQKGGAYTRTGLSSIWDRAKERIGMKDDVVFRAIRALAATDAVRRGENRSDIQKRLVHTSGKTTDIYIKEVIADVSEIPMALPWFE